MRPINLITQPSWVKSYAWICAAVAVGLAVGAFLVYAEPFAYFKYQPSRLNVHYSISEIQLVGYLRQESDNIEKTAGLIKTPDEALLVRIGDTLGREKGRITDIQPERITVSIPGQKESVYICETTLT